MIDLRFPNFPFSKILGWSNSRFDLFCSCKRKYYYSYYSKFCGDLVPKINELKNLTSVALEVGNLYHDFMEVFLERMQKSDTPLDKAKLLNFVGSLCQKKLPTKTFFEQYYRTADVDFAQIEARVKNCVEIFLDSSIFDWIKSINMDERKLWLVEAGSKMNGKKYFGETKIGGLKAYCKMDFVFVKAAQIHIIDWKTGQKDEVKHKKQLLAYATAAKNLSEQINSDDIFTKAVYLKDGYDEINLKFSDEDILGFIDTVALETNEMLAFCSNVEENIPTSIDNFEKCGNSGFCRYCEFQELCR